MEILLSCYKINFTIKNINLNGSIIRHHDVEPTIQINSYASGRQILSICILIVTSEGFQSCAINCLYNILKYQWESVKEDGSSMFVKDFACGILCAFMNHLSSSLNLS